MYYFYNMYFYVLAGPFFRVQFELNTSAIWALLPETLVGFDCRTWEEMHFVSNLAIE